jgi:hypothetical protein
MRQLALLLAVALGSSGVAAAPPFDWTLTLENGDFLHCSLLAIEGGRLVVRWAVSPEEPLRLDLKAVSNLVREGDEKEWVSDPPAGVDVLRLIDDSVLCGRAVSITPAHVDFEVPQVGRLTIPASFILDLSRVRHEVLLPEVNGEQFAVAMRNGTALSGKLVTDEGGRLVLKSDGLTATIDYESLALLVFPRVARAEEEETAPVAGLEVRLKNGSVIGGRDPSLADGTLRFRTGGVDAAVALSEVATISFRDYGPTVGRSGLRSVLVWGRWSDVGEEFKKTVEVVRAQTKGKWKITESMADRYDDAFRRELFAARVLLIPEMEKLPQATGDAAEMRPLLHAFLRAGGNVVVCGAQGAHLQWLRDAGLVDLDGVGTVDGAEVTLSPKGAMIGKGVTTFQAMNAANAYVIRSGDAVALAAAGGRALVVGRRVGRGFVIVVGFDYYQTNEGANTLLGNAVQLR